MPDEELIRVLSEIQRRGAIGGQPLAAAIAHADRFVEAIPPSARTLVDLGSGGGLPGLVIAHRRRDLEVTLVERRAKRADLLHYGVRALGLSATVAVFHGDASVLGGVVPKRWDVVTARSFGPFVAVLAVARRVVRDGGLVLVSEPPPGRQAVASTLGDGVVDRGVIGGIRAVTMFHVEPSVRD